jgi:hypothetical protein
MQFFFFSALLYIERWENALDVRASNLQRACLTPVTFYA